MQYQEQFRDALTGEQIVFYEQIKKHKCQKY